MGPNGLRARTTHAKRGVTARKAGESSHQPRSCHGGPNHEIFGQRDAKGEKWAHFQHPVKAEKKHGKIIIVAIMCKLLRQMHALVTKDVAYDPNFFAKVA